MSLIWSAICAAESSDNREELQRIFASITTDDLNKTLDIEPNSILLTFLVNIFDEENKYPHFLLNLLDSSNVDPSRLNINYKNTHNGMTTLMHAANRGHLKVAEKLISWGANPQVETYNFKTAFFCACNMGHVRVARFLLPFIKKREFKLRRSYNGRTIKEEMETKLVFSPNAPKAPNFLELKQLIDEKMAEIAAAKAAKYAIRQGARNVEITEE